jgi:O-methyltransferase
MKLRQSFRKSCPWVVLYVFRQFNALREDLPHILKFLLSATRTPTSFLTRSWLAAQCYRISFHVECPHREGEALRVIQAILNLHPLAAAAVAEAGCYKGGSSAKLSLAAKVGNRRLYLFDSFEGMPSNAEDHGRSIYGESVAFPEGSYKGSLNEVRRNIAIYGAPEVCNFVKGWFSDTMPAFGEQLGVVYIDVDLRSSTATCLQYLYPLLIPHGIVFSQDGHLPLVVKLLDDDAFWRTQVLTSRPRIEGLGRIKLLTVYKS